LCVHVYVFEDEFLWYTSLTESTRNERGKGKEDKNIRIYSHVDAPRKFNDCIEVDKGYYND
jgi:hypothetical protein